MNVQEMTIDDLKALRAASYEQARRDGIIGKLGTIARELGAELDAKYGPKYEWKSADIVIYVDDYGNYMQIRMGERLVCSTHQTEKLFIHGPWLDRILPHYADAIWRKTDREQKRAEKERRQLAAMLEPA